MGFQNRDLITNADMEFLAAQERNHQLVSQTFDRIHIENACARLTREAKRLQKAMREAGQVEAAECVETALCALSDAEEEVK